MQQLHLNLHCAGKEPRIHGLSLTRSPHEAEPQFGVREGLTDVEVGHVISDEELGKRLDAELGDPEAE